MASIVVSIGTIEIIIDCLDTPTAKKIVAALPFDSIAQTWGQEVYFSTPVQTERENNAKDVVEPGEIAFWVEGDCIAIGYGPTPISEGNEIRLAAKTNIWGHTKDNLDVLSNVKPGETISLKTVD
ncbi:MAG: hypothetical protein MI865_10285 [Proteobacteria bacterium]|nr:hypothetical protein [Pseudomonadota bacterium]